LEDIPGTSIDLPIEMSEKCAIGSEKKTEILTAEQLSSISTISMYSLKLLHQTYRLINTFNKQTYNIKESIKKHNFKIQWENKRERQYQLYGY
jgi:hypothetical protein